MIELIENFRNKQILCLGDVMLDRFISGKVQRISPESPVPVLAIGESTLSPGGAANVARNIAMLEGRCTLIGLAGKDAAGMELAQCLSGFAGIKAELVRTSHRRTTEKTRFIAMGQHMLRVDTEDSGPLRDDVERDIIRAVEAALPRHHALILSDYAKGVLSDNVINASITLAKAQKIPVIVDPKSAEFKRYNGADIITPNAREASLASGIEPKDLDSTLAAGREILAHTTLSWVLITRSEHGMSLIGRDVAPVDIPAARREVADVVGAGDTVAAVLALALAAGASPENAARLSNAAAGIVVSKRGTAGVTPSELRRSMERTQANNSTATARLVHREDIAALAQCWRRDGLVIGFTNGCFDLLHAGHAALIRFARSHCDRLIVGLNSDASVRRLKGPDRPINDEHHRGGLLAALAHVDAVTIFEEDTPAALIGDIQPNLLVKGADYALGEIAGARQVLARGGKVLRFELIPGLSSTELLRRAARDSAA